MARHYLAHAALFFVAALLLLAVPAQGKVLYSLDADSPSRVGVSNSDVLALPPAAAPARAVDVSPIVETTAAALGLSGERLDEVDALSRGGSGSGAFHFSVDRFSLDEGAAKAGRAPSSSDDLDALALERPGPLFFSLAAGNLFAFGGADVLAPGPSVAIPASALGLGFLDDIDALHVDGVNRDVYFSLTPASPSLATLGASPADVLVVRGGAGRPEVFAAAVELGLDPGDNVDALAFAGAEEPGGVLELAGPCVTASPDVEAGRAGPPRTAVSDLVFVGGVAAAPAARLHPACGRDLALRAPALVACVAGPRVSGASCP